MISHENAYDLIDTVTAEIEAIIQEEINSQNAPETIEEIQTPLEVEPVQAVPIELLESITEPVEEVTNEPESLVSNEEVIVQEDLGVQESVVEHEETAIEHEDTAIDHKETAIDHKETAIEHEETVQVQEESAVTQTQDNNTIQAQEVNDIPAVVAESEEIVTEYIVKIGSPSQEKDAEVVEDLVAVPLIESILNDAPIDDNDGPRAKHFKQALRKALNNTVKSCSGDKLETCFPFNLKANQFSQINSTILTALKSVIDGVQEPFDEFLESESLVEKLNKVDEFTRSRVPGASETSEASFTPQNLIDRKIYGSKLASIAKLEQLAQKLESENSQLFAELNNRQTEFADRLDRLKSSQQLLDAALDQSSTISMDDLEVLVDKMNHQYQPSALKIHN